MDQNSTDGTDKRNWRERLGIGAKDGMPRIAEEFKEPARASAGSARLVAPAVKPAPMAPRMAPRAPAAAAGAPAPAFRQPSPAQDALAVKLRAQRDAAEKLAEQRVNAARQRSEPQASEQPAKPKFSFADPDAPKPQAAAPARPAAAPPKFPAQSQPTTQLQPPRQQLGQGNGFKPLPPAAPPSYAQQPPQQRPAGVPPQQPYQRQYTQPPYQPTQGGYRPIDPATGYTAPPGYVPPQQRSNYAPPPGYQPQPSARAGVPARSGNPAYAPAPADLRPTPRLGAGQAMRQPPQMGFEDDQDDIFEQSAPAPMGRRATANDYQQAYRNTEPVYDEDLPRSRLPLILMILLVLALASGIGGIWAYNNLIKGTSTPIANGDAAAPVVAAPAQPAKVNPDATAPAKSDTAPAAGSNKKQIYDRIVGDHEVLSGQMKSTEEAPVQPDANAAPPAPGDNSNTGTGDNGMPLPLPPPPGSSGGTQGTLEQNKNTNVAQIAPAAEPSSAANSTGAKPPAAAAAAPALAPASNEPPVPSSQPSKLATADQGANTITDQPDPVPPTTAKPAAKSADAKKATAPKAEVAKGETTKAEKSLGSSPVVLVPPAQVASADPVVTPISQPPGNAQNSLYNGPAVGTPVQPASPAVAAPATPAKRKTLGDLFKSTAPATTPGATPAPGVASATPVAPAAPATTSAPVAGGFVAQLASFKTRAEASDEYARLAKKHGAIISKYAPIIETAEVAGSPRFRLNIGPMATMEVATNLCSALFSAGERDCVVHRQ